MMFEITFHPAKKKDKPRVVVIDAPTEDDANEWGIRQAFQWKHTGAVSVEKSKSILANLSPEDRQAALSHEGPEVSGDFAKRNE